MATRVASSATISQLTTSDKSLEAMALYIGIGGGGAGGALAPPVGVRSPSFGQNFGQFHVFWAFCVKISGNFIFFGHYCVKILGNVMSSGQVCFGKYSECWIEKPSQGEFFFEFFFFLEVTTI